MHKSSNRAAGFETQAKKNPPPPILRPIWEKPLPPVLRPNWEQPFTTSFEAKPRGTIVTGFETKPEKIVPVILRPNH
jgi:hypothetical protein